MEAISNEVFANLLQEHSAVFLKSQLPSIRREKTESLHTLKNKIEALCGKPIILSSISKKINNMKMRVKQKTDVNRTGDQKIVLKEWERLIHEMLDRDSNPTISTIPGALTVGGEETCREQQLPEISLAQVELVMDTSECEPYMPVTHEEEKTIPRNRGNSGPHITRTAKTRVAETTFGFKYERGEAQKRAENVKL